MSATAALQLKKDLATAVRRKMAVDHLNIAGFARKTKTGRNSVKRLLDGRNTAITLKTMVKAAEALGLKLSLTVEPLPVAKLDALAQRMVEAPTKDEAERLKEALLDGFYGQPSASGHAQASAQ